MSDEILEDLRKQLEALEVIYKKAVAQIQEAIAHGEIAKINSGVEIKYITNELYTRSHEEGKFFSIMWKYNRVAVPAPGEWYLDGARMILQTNAAPPPEHLKAIFRPVHGTRVAV